MPELDYVEFFRGLGFDVRHLRQDTARLYSEILAVFDEGEPPMTVRQVFYQLTTRGAVPKTEQGYKNVGYHLLSMRRRGWLPYSYIADNTRWMRKPRTYDSLHAFLEISREAYRRAIWQDQEAYVEVWCEKDALAGVLIDVTSKWDVPLMVAKGFSSETFAYEAAQNIIEQDKLTYIYHFGDLDPSGVAARNDLERKLKQFGAQVIFYAPAVQPWQVTEWNLPTRPTKKTDSRSRDWPFPWSVELDAIPARGLRRLCEECITQHIDERVLAETMRAERLERESLDTVLENLGRAPSFREAAHA